MYVCNKADALDTQCAIIQSVHVTCSPRTHHDMNAAAAALASASDDSATVCKDTVKYPDTVGLDATMYELP
jgi:hypothetical protein